MKTGLSKREIKLLFGAGLVLILYLSIQFAIIPLSNAYNAGLDERDQLRTERDFHNMEAEMLPSLRTRSTETRERFYALTSGYSVIVPNELTDQRLTTLCGGNNMRISSLSFIQPPPAPPPPPQYDYEGNLIEEDEADTYPVFTYVTAVMGLTGTYNSLMNLIDEVIETEYIRITSASFTRIFRDGIEESDISLTFEVTYLSGS
jgi:hypothetical protein